MRLTTLTTLLLFTLKNGTEKPGLRGLGNLTSLFSQKGDEKQIIVNPERLPAGIYCISITDIKGNNYVKKAVKEWLSLLGVVAIGIEQLDQAGEGFADANIKVSFIKNSTFAFPKPMSNGNSIFFSRLFLGR